MTHAARLACPHTAPTSLAARCAAALCLAALCLAACGSDPAPSEPTEPEPETAAEPPPAAPDPPAEQAAPAVDDTAYGRALTELNAQVGAYEAAAERYGQQDWGRYERLSGIYAARAKLTGDYDDYVRAQEAMARAFEIAPEGSGPFMGRANLNFTLHRLAQAEADIASAEGGALVSVSDHNRAVRLRADLAFHRGRFAEAERMHRANDEAQPSPGGAFQVAYDLWQTGRYDQADRWLQTALGRVLPANHQTQAWMNLQRGLMDLDRGRYEDALAHYEEADRLFDGWWLVHEHLAEIHALLGHLDEAERRYRDVVERTGNPELIDALADVLEQQGDEEAASFRARADAAFEHQLEILPEAAYGHALQHFLQHGTAERALTLAEANYELRPGAEATVRLAQALLRSDRADDARARLSPLLETPYRSAEMYATMALIFRALQEPDDAAAQERLAVAINPHAMEDVSWLAE